MLNPSNPRPQYQTFPQDPNDQVPKEWNKDLFSCFDDIEVCAMSCCCHCFQYAKIQTKFDQSNYWNNCLLYSAVAYFLTPCLPCFVGKFREDVRGRYKISGSFLEDCFTHCCCHCCALVQETKELEHREGGKF